MQVRTDRCLGSPLAGLGPQARLRLARPVLRTTPKGGLSDVVRSAKRFGTSLSARLERLGEKDGPSGISHSPMGFVGTQRGRTLGGWNDSFASRARGRGLASFGRAFSRTKPRPHLDQAPRLARSGSARSHHVQPGNQRRRDFENR